MFSIIAPPTCKSSCLKHLGEKMHPEEIKQRDPLPEKENKSGAGPNKEIQLAPRFFPAGSSSRTKHFLSSQRVLESSRPQLQPERQPP